MECVIAGWPIPVVEWEKYGDILPEKRSEVVHGTLYLYNIRLDDRGTYICRASSANGQSDIAYTALVEVLGKKKMVMTEKMKYIFYFHRIPKSCSATRFINSSE
jgi:hypothetical protein